MKFQARGTSIESPACTLVSSTRPENCKSRNVRLGRLSQCGAKLLAPSIALALVMLVEVTANSSAIALPEERPIASESRPVTESSPTKKVGAWARTRLCSGRLREHMKDQHLSWHDQAQYLRDCRNEGRGDLFDASSPRASIKAWTKRQWEAARKKWQQDHAKFYDCNDKWKAQSLNKGMSFHDQNAFLFSCMNEKP